MCTTMTGSQVSVGVGFLELTVLFCTTVTMENGHLETLPSAGNKGRLNS